MTLKPSACYGGSAINHALGAFFANVVCLPIAFKLAVRAGEEKLNQSLVLDGIVGIADGQNPRVIEGVLKNYLAASKRGSAEEE